MSTNFLERDLQPHEGSLPAAGPAAKSTLQIDVPAVYERAGPFEIRLADDDRDLKQAQRLRYEVFYEEGAAIATAAARAARRDLCPFDAICDHLVIVDTATGSATGKRKPCVVGTYRLLRRDQADRHNGFYSEGEFDLAPLLARHERARLLELGRSCVHPDYRSKRVVELLWRGLWLYAMHHRIDALIGCASFPETNLDALRQPLSFLRNVARLDPSWDVVAWPHCAAEPTLLSPELVDARRASAALPPLIKAYLRTGARFGGSVAVDRQFGTTDVFVVMPIRDIEERYRAHYGAPSCVPGAPVA